jgi:hypothetical protein
MSGEIKPVMQRRFKQSVAFFLRGEERKFLPGGHASHLEKGRAIIYLGEFVAAYVTPWPRNRCSFATDFRAANSSEAAFAFKT